MVMPMGRPTQRIWMRSWIANLLAEKERLTRDKGTTTRDIMR